MTPLKFDSAFFAAATVANMRKCEKELGVIMLDYYGNEWSATPGDYFMYGEDEIIETDGEPNILVKRSSCFVHPLTREPW